MNPIFIVERKKILLVNHQLTDYSEKNTEMLARLYKWNECLVSRVHFDYGGKSFIPVAKQIQKSRTSRELAVSIRLADSPPLSTKTARRYPLIYLNVLTAAASVAHRYKFDIVVFPDVYLRPDFIDHAAYLLKCASDNAVIFHAPFCGQPPTKLEKITEAYLNAPKGDPMKRRLVLSLTP